MKVELTVTTQKREELINIEPEIKRIVTEQGWTNGLLTIFIPHTTAAVTINENADPDVMRDILFRLTHIVPDHGYKHNEGNSGAHIRASLFGMSEIIIVENSTLQLGTWQSPFFCEFDGPRKRKTWVSFTKK